MNNEELIKAAAKLWDLIEEVVNGLDKGKVKERVDEINALAEQHQLPMKISPELVKELAQRRLDEEGGNDYEDSNYEDSYY